MELEFVDETPEYDEVEPVARRSLPRTVRWIAVAAAAAGIVVFIAERQPQDARRPIATPSVQSTPSPTATTLSPQDENLNLIYLRSAGAPEPGVVTRDGSTSAGCAAVSIDTAPQNTAADVLEKGLDGYVEIDSSRVIDQNAGLCSLVVRARNPAGTVAVLQVVSPTQQAHESASPNIIQSAVSHRHTKVVEYVQFRTTDGWVVLLGTSGPRGDQPSTKALAVVAVDSRLRW